MSREPENLREVQLTAEEYVGIRAAVASGAGRRASGQECTLNGLFAAWLGIVQQLEDDEGYSWCGAEFINDVWCRSALARVWPLLPERVRQIRQGELDGLDDRFRAATVPRSGHDADESQWYLWRIPRLLQADPTEPLERGWPTGWDLPFPKPGTIKVVSWS